MFDRRSGKVWVLFLLVAMAAMVLSGCIPSASAAPTPAAESPARTITVVGRGEVKAKPDIATVNLGVEVLAATVDEAMGQAADRMKAILATLKGLGIAEKDIQTSNFSISFERQGPITLPAVEGTSGAKAGSQETPAGFYRVSNMVQVTVRDLDKVGDVLDAAVEAGANNVWGVSFGLDDTDALEAQAREKAVANGRSRAESLAKLNGVNVGEVIAVSEVIGGTPGVMFAEAAARGLGGGGAPVEPGEITFSTQVQIVYAIR